MMKVLHLIPDLGLGGAQRALCYLAAAMDRNRFQMQVAIWGHQEDLCKELENLGVDVVHLQGVDRSLVRLALALGSHVRRTRPDVIHTHLFDADLVGTVVAWVCGVQCCSTIHSATFFTTPAHRWRYRCLALLVRRFFPVSLALSDVLIQRCHVPADQVRVIRNGIDTTRFAPSRARDGADARGPIIGTLARLDPRKGIRILLDAMPHLLPEYPEALLLVGGAGEEKEALERQARALGLADRVVFAGPVHEPRDFYRRLDLFVLPSLDEGFGLVVLEAMAMGLPVIGARVGGVPEILTHGVNGWLVEPGDSAGLAAGIRTLWADPALRRQVAEEGRRTAQRLDITQTAMQLQTEYERMT
jgi:glycosyltransferase involved in cell wall biosynthesis